MSGAIADPVRGIVRVEGGTVWEPAVEAAAAHGRAVLHGSSPDVGIAGYSLGGGIGWYARKLGLATNSLTAVELVIGDGTLVRADATTNPEIFWAVRGGGGSFGVVTALEFRTYDIRTAYAGMMVWDLDRIEPVLREWAAWAPEAPDEVTTSLRALRLPPLPELPDFLRGRRLCVVDGAVLDTDDRAAGLLAGLRALRPEIDTFSRVPAKSLVRLHMDPEGGAPAVSDSAMLGGLPTAAVDAFLEQAGPDAETSLLAAELRQLGGALGRPPRAPGPSPRLDAAFVAFGVAMAPSLEAAVRGPGGRHRAGRGARPVGQRAHVPELRGAPRRHPLGVRRLRVAPARRDPQRRGPARDLRGEPPGAPALGGRPGDQLNGRPRVSGRVTRGSVRRAGRPRLEPGLEAHQRRGAHRQLDVPLGAGAADHDVVGVERHLLDALRAPAGRRR